MARITEDLIELVKRQIKEHGIVVWYDPKKSYAGLVENLTLPETTILRFSDGFFHLREQIEPYLEFVADDGTLQAEAAQPPSLLIYIPMARDDTEYALIEVETAGTVIEPGAVQPECNTSLSLLVKQVFGELNPARADQLARQADDGLLTLEELDRLAEEAGSAATGTLQIVFGNTTVEDMLLQFIISESYDDSIMQKKALPELAELAFNELGLKKSRFTSASLLRKALQRYLLLTDMLLQIPKSNMPQAFSQQPVPEKPVQRDLVLRLCQKWRNRYDPEDKYVDIAKEVEKDTGVSTLDLPLDQLQEAETFLSIERRWLDRAADKILKGEIAEAYKIANKRLGMFWSRKKLAFQMEWKVIEAAASVCIEASRIKEELKSRQWALDELIRAYAEHAAPWMRLDRLARHLEITYEHLTMIDAGSEPLDKLIALARQRYTDTLQQQSLMYQQAAAKASLSTQKFLPHTSLYREIVRPLLDKQLRAAFFLVDALRYEMAEELLEGLRADFECKIQPVMGQLPGITPVGMSALLPEADGRLAVVKKGNGIDVTCQDSSTASRQARITWLQEKVGINTVFLKLDEVVRLTPKRKKDLESAHLIVVTSQEIDRRGEEDADEEGATSYMHEVLDKLRRAVRVLTRSGIQQFIISTDHGYQLLPQIDPGLAMDPPGGETLDLHPRVWIGRGGSSAAGYVRFHSTDLQLGGTLEYAFPRGLGTFRVRGGAGRYLHGGISLQEQILPLLMIQPKGETAMPSAKVKIKLSMAKTKITNRLFTVMLQAEQVELLPGMEKRVRVEILSEKLVVGAAEAAAYDFDQVTHEVGVRPGQVNAITLMLQSAEIPKTVTIQAVDCETQLVLDALKDIPVELGI